MERFDVVVLGAGPGGYVAAIRAAQLDGKVAIVEKNGFGGTCLNRGCIPTKTYVKNAEILHNIKTARKRGILVGEASVDMEAMVQMKNTVVNQLANGVHGLLKANGVTIYQGVGTVKEKNILSVEANGQKIEIGYNKLIIATGSENFIPPIKGVDDDILTSTELLNLKEIPKSLVIIGGGVIGCEFATVYEALGTKVTIVERLPRLIANLDADLSAQLQKNLKKKKVDVLVNHSVSAIEKGESDYKVHIKKQDTGEDIEISAERVLVSVGRKPNLDGLEQLELETNGNYIKVDGGQRTSVKNVYAIGDVTGTILLAHVASAQGRTAAENAMGMNQISNLDVVPSCIYTIPEIGSVGITEEEARERYHNISVGKFPVVGLGKALAMGETEGSFKIIIETETKKVLGVHIFGANATDLIMEAAVVMRAGGTLDMITDTIHAHPTMAEGMMEVAHAAEDLCVHMPPPQK